MDFEEESHLPTYLEMGREQKQGIKRIWQSLQKGEGATPWTDLIVGYLLG